MKRAPTKKEEASTSPCVAPPASLSSLQANYRTGYKQLADFFSLCLREATKYRRSAGYFSSTALLTWAEALPRLVAGNALSIQLIAAPEVSPQDIKVFKQVATEEQRADLRQIIVERMLNEVIALTEDSSDNGARARILAWLIANDRLHIKFAFAKHIDYPGIFHEKMGVFDFAGGLRVAFTGSANETLGGHERNYESIDVFRNWVEADVERIRTKEAQFDEAWNNTAEGLEVESPSPKTVARLRARAPKRLPINGRDSDLGDANDHQSSRWRHQDEAVEMFLAKRCGVLEMATGTGKTRTALKILDRLVGSGELRSAVIATEGTDLLDQWGSELDRWALNMKPNWVVTRQFERHKQLGLFALDSNNAVLAVSLQQLANAVHRIPRQHKGKMIIVHDEIQGLGAPSLVQTLRGEHQHFGWRLGLSATPERSYDEEGNQFILDEVGPTIFGFPLEKAIARGVLSEFDYLPLPYKLTKGDRKRLRAVYARQAVRKKVGNPMSNEELWRELAKVYKTAEMKPEVFSAHLKENSNLLRSCIVFVETKVTEIISSQRFTSTRRGTGPTTPRMIGSTW